MSGASAREPADELADGPADGPADDGELRAADGRVPGRRGLATRQRLLDCTGVLLGQGSYRDIKVVDIARDAQTSPATFYQYFADVESAILALAEEMAAGGTEQLCGPVRNGSWTGAAAFATADEISGAFIAFWDENWPLMRVLELTSEEGDQRFRAIRTRLLNEFTRELAGVIAIRQAASRRPSGVDPMATAGVLVSMLAHVAAHRYGFEFYGIRTAELRRSMAHIVYTTVTGQRPPTAPATV